MNREIIPFHFLAYHVKRRVNASLESGSGKLGRRVAWGTPAVQLVATAGRRHTFHY